jgi:hypothetical protein
VKARKRLILAAAPAECPRESDGGVGPRVCVYTACPWHVLCPPARGPYKPDQLLPGDDFCVRDIAVRGPSSTAAIAERFNVSSREIRNVLCGCKRKLAPTLANRVSDGETFRRNRG